MLLLLYLFIYFFGMWSLNSLARDHTHPLHCKAKISTSELPGSPCVSSYHLLSLPRDILHIFFSSFFLLLEYKFHDGGDFPDFFLYDIPVPQIAVSGTF